MPRWRRRSHRRGPPAGAPVANGGRHAGDMRLRPRRPWGVVPATAAGAPLASGGPIVADMGPRPRRCPRHGPRCPVGGPVPCSTRLRPGLARPRPPRHRARLAQICAVRMRSWAGSAPDGHPFAGGIGTGAASVARGHPFAVGIRTGPASPVRGHPFTGGMGRRPPPPTRGHPFARRMDDKVVRVTHSRGEGADTEPPPGGAVGPPPRAQLWGGRRSSEGTTAILGRRRCIPRISDPSGAGWREWSLLGLRHRLEKMHP